MIEVAARGVLEARSEFAEVTLAELYDPLAMPPALVWARQRLDALPGRGEDCRTEEEEGELMRSRGREDKEPRSRRAAEKEGPAVEVLRTGPRNRRRWTPRMVRRLGAASDEDIARELGISLTSVSRERRRRGIATFRPRRSDFEWTDRALRLLGAASDHEVAAELGISYSIVNRKRRILGISSFHPPPHRKAERRWLPWEEKLLGAMSDAKVAKRIGCSVLSVSLRRRQLGIPRFGRLPAPIRWTRRWLSKLGKVTDRALAREMGVSVSAVVQRRRLLGIPARYEKRVVAMTPALRRLLREPNIVVERRTGLKTDTIVKLRKEHGIPPPPAFRDRPWTRAAMKRLGKVPDAQLARELGVCMSAVRGRRLRAGIPAFRPWRRFTPAERNLLRSELPVEELVPLLGRPTKTIRAARAYERKRRSAEK